MAPGMHIGVEEPTPEEVPSSATGRSTVGLTALAGEGGALQREDRMLEFTVENELLGDNTRVVSVAGELDMYTAPSFEQQLRDALDDGARVVIDLSGCSFMDSTALGILLSTRKQLDAQNGRLVLVAADRNILKLFEITGLEGTFTIVPTRAAATNGATRV
jgi:anti-sigma B factor antagonist